MSESVGDRLVYPSGIGERYGLTYRQELIKEIAGGFAALGMVEISDGAIAHRVNRIFALADGIIARLDDKKRKGEATSLDGALAKVREALFMSPDRHCHPTYQGLPGILLYISEWRRGGSGHMKQIMDLQAEVHKLKVKLGELEC